MKFGQMRSENDRVVFLVLLVCMTIITAGCVMGIIYLHEYNFYKTDENKIPDGGRTAKSVAVQIYSADDVKLAKDYFLCRETDNIYGTESNEYKSNYYATRFSLKNTNFIFAVYDVDGELLFDSMNPDKKDGMPSFETADIDPEYRGQSDFFFFDMDSASRTLRLEYGILAREKQTANDKYSNSFKWIDAAHSLRYFVFVVLFIAVSVIMFLLSVFTVNAGTIDEETGEIIPGFIDKLPLDFVTLCLVLLFLSARMVFSLTEASDVDMVLGNVVVMIVFVVAVLIIMTYLTTVSVRFKMHLRKINGKSQTR